MAQAFSNFLPARQDVGGVIGLGGSGGSAIITPALQAMPIGVPKIMVSTLASGDVSAYVGTSDIQMINPVTAQQCLAGGSGKCRSRAGRYDRAPDQTT
jgi:uncharacterized protein (UPF0261 family)